MRKSHDVESGLKLPPLNSLRAFVAAAKHGSFSRAADELAVTQGAVSRHVAKLEDWLGAPLFSRANQRVELNQRGRFYYVEVYPLLERIAEATRRVDSHECERILYINAPPTFTLLWLIPHLPVFHSLHPNIQVRLIASISPIDFTRDGCDVAIRSSPHAVPGLRHRELIHEYLFPVCSPDFFRSTPVRRHDDMKHVQLLCADTRPGDWPAWLRAAGAPPLNAFRTSSFEQVYFALRAATAGAGVALGPWPLVHDDLVAGRLRSLLPRPIIHQRTHYLQFQERRDEDESLMALCDWLVALGQEFIGINWRERIEAGHFG